MNIDERLESVARNLDMLTRIHLDSEREYRERLDRIEGMQEKNARDIQALAVLAKQDGEHIRALARIAERHQDRLDNLDPQ